MAEVRPPLFEAHFVALRGQTRGSTGRQSAGCMGCPCRHNIENNESCRKYRKQLGSGHTIFVQHLPSGDCRPTSPMVSITTVILSTAWDCLVAVIE